ncbi:hypothetical protein BKP35_16195 [Anaerobacillus arseniciselenatis]|uniref:Uncharacterized protein n=1 Tax=Anaerobacillus arseniciselenatis TaxID=85682 RepID=A0A1S2LCD4_9BACI|nr:hypothetical protein [Anaerobacillus arseniciselenatis]OIJ09397.1 hypothetical protein BKP35_16195 [Anaerobacillus arseniciselenatis]
MFKTPIVFISLDVVEFFEKPYFDGSKWYNLSLDRGEQRIFLSETRSAMLNVPVGRDEEPSGYIYSVYGNDEECYIPVYDRTSKVELENLYPTEIVSE